MNCLLYGLGLIVLVKLHSWLGCRQRELELDRQLEQSREETKRWGLFIKTLTERSREETERLKLQVQILTGDRNEDSRAD